MVDGECSAGDLVWYRGALVLKAVLDFRDECRSAVLAETTRKTYATGWQSWASWASHYKVVELPADPDFLEFWLADLAIQGRTVATLRVYLAGVFSKHRNAGYDDPIRNTKLRELMAGLTRKLARERRGVPRQAMGLRWLHIKSMLECAKQRRFNQPGGRLESPEQARERSDFWAALLCVLHDGALRCGELRALRWDDLQCVEKGCYVIWVRRSKTDQQGLGAAVALSGFTVKALLKIKPKGVDGNPLIFDVSASTVSRIVKRAARDAGYDTKLVSTHSLRVGMAQDLAASGVDTVGLMLAGRWSSPVMVARYTHALKAHQSPVGDYLKTQT